MKYVLENTEPTVQLSLIQAKSYLNDDKEGDNVIELIGKPAIGASWLLATITSDGRFLPNKTGCAKVGLTIDNIFNQNNQ